MYTALERNRLYRIGSTVLLYTGREWPEDHPPLFCFTDVETGDTITFLLEQLTAFEQTGDLSYTSTTPI